MKYINPFSKEGFVNLFADHIIKNIDPKHKTRIQVVDFKSFIVVYGATSSDEVIDLNKLRDTFIDSNTQLVNFLNIKHVNIIDLIDYREPLSPTEYYFEYYNSSRPIFHQKVIDEVKIENLNYNKEFLSSINYTDKINLEFYSPFSPENLQIFNLTNYLSISSSFPYGYSLNLSRREFYYGEYICNHLFNMLEIDKIIFKFSSIKNEDDDFNIDVMCDWHSDTYSIYPKNKIKSLILDVFDFNLNKFSNDYLNDYNVEKDIQNQLEEKPWLVKDKVKDLVIF